MTIDTQIDKWIENTVVNRFTTVVSWPIMQQQDSKNRLTKWLNMKRALITHNFMVKSVTWWFYISPLGQWRFRVDRRPSPPRELGLIVQPSDTAAANGQTANPPSVASLSPSPEPTAVTPPRKRYAATKNT